MPRLSAHRLEAEQESDPAFRNFNMCLRKYIGEYLPLDEVRLEQQIQINYTPRSLVHPEDYTPEACLHTTWNSLELQARLWNRPPPGVRSTSKPFDGTMLSDAVACELGFFRHKKEAGGAFSELKRAETKKGNELHALRICAALAGSAGAAGGTDMLEPANPDGKFTARVGPSLESSEMKYCEYGSLRTSTALHGAARHCTALHGTGARWRGLAWRTVHRRDMSRAPPWRNPCTTMHRVHAWVKHRDKFGTQSWTKTSTG
ncbi:hypothetical protein C8F04DRAFT_1196120 [Mycena alexandri]|uniref:Uncharacterized protein n=1 Tax=Mycena alexandri TaxID=1745969 RepID=A0AAD6S602_9AGAR|nr:hypothetical protein C8F04DRAFT_1196120 [Mycena alexandri]